MASQKITNDPALLGSQLDRANDVLPVVDVSAGSAGNKKITTDGLMVGAPATSEKAGSMSALDKTKLDAIDNTKLVSTDTPQAVTGLKTFSQVSSIGLKAVSTKPTAPASDTVLVYNKNISNKPSPIIQSADGKELLLQTGFARNHTCLITPMSSGTFPDSIGQALNTSGTVSHPSPTDDLVPYMANFATAATTNSFAGTSQAGRIYCRGSNANGFGGFYYFARLYFPDASYPNARIFIGMNGTGSFWFDGAVTSGEDVSGDRVGFQFSTIRSDVNWQFITRDGAAQNVIDTTAPFTVQKLYDFYIYCPKASSVIYYQLDNLTDGVSYAGNTSSNLPTANAYMAAGFQLRTLNNTARNIRMYRVYSE